MDSTENALSVHAKESGRERRRKRNRERVGSSRQIVRCVVGVARRQRQRQRRTETQIAIKIVIVVVVVVALATAAAAAPTAAVHLLCRLGARVLCKSFFTFADFFSYFFFGLIFL